MFYLNTIEQLFLFVEQLFQLEVRLPYSRLLAGIPILAVFQNLRWNSNKHLYIRRCKNCWAPSETQLRSATDTTALHVPIDVFYKADRTDF